MDYKTIVIIIVGSSDVIIPFVVGDNSKSLEALHNKYSQEELEVPRRFGALLKPYIEKPRYILLFWITRFLAESPNDDNLKSHFFRELLFLLNEEPVLVESIIEVVKKHLAFSPNEDEVYFSSTIPENQPWFQVGEAESTGLIIRPPTDLVKTRAEVEFVSAIFVSAKSEVIDVKADQVRKGKEYLVWFATNRKPINTDTHKPGFSNERDETLHYGRCEVFIPKSHKIGSLGSAWWERLLKWQDDRLKLNEVFLDTPSFFWSNLRDKIKDNASERGKECLIFIHGYNVTFEDAALRTAQLGADLGIEAPTAFFSWPSTGSISSYTVDEAAIEASEEFITRFLVEFSQEANADYMHIIAHSMGNRGLLRAFQRIINSAEIVSKIKFGQIILAAPDVDAQLFSQLAWCYSKLSQRTTLYISNKDKPLKVSSAIHSYPRAGIMPPVTVVDGIDSVTVENIDFSLLGHGYYAAARDILHDMHQLLTNNTPPNKRMGIEQSDDKKYWIIKT